MLMSSNKATSAISRKFAKNAAFLSAATGFSQLLGFSALAITATYISVGEIGEYAVFLAYFGMFERVVSLGYPMAIPNLRDTELASAQVATALVVLGMSIAGYLLLSQISPFLAIPIACGSLAGGLTRIHQMLQVRNKNYRLLGILRVAPSIGLVIAALVGLAADLGSAAFLIYSHVICLAGTSLLWIICTGTVQTIATSRSISLNSIAMFLKQGSQYPLMVAPSELCNAAALALPTILIQMWFPAGNVLAAQYSVTRRIGFSPLGMIGQGISRVFHGELSASIRGNDSNYAETYQSLRRKLIVATFAVACGFVVLGPTAVSMIFGKEWQLAGNFLSILAPAFALSLLAAPLAVVFYTCNAHRVLLQSQLLILAISIFSIAAGAWMSSITLAITLLSALLSGRFLWILAQSNKIVASHYLESCQQTSKDNGITLPQPAAAA